MTLTCYKCPCDVRAPLHAAMCHDYVWLSSDLKTNIVRRWGIVYVIDSTHEAEICHEPCQNSQTVAGQCTVFTIHTPLTVTVRHGTFREIMVASCSHLVHSNNCMSLHCCQFRVHVWCVSTCTKLRYCRPQTVVHVRVWWLVSRIIPVTLFLVAVWRPNRSMKRVGCFFEWYSNRPTLGTQRDTLQCAACSFVIAPYTSRSVVSPQR